MVTTYTGAGSIVPESLIIEPGSSATFELQPDEGYYLADATGCHGLLDKEKLDYHVNNVNESCSIEVSFKPLKLSIKTNLPEGRPSRCTPARRTRRSCLDNHRRGKYFATKWQRGRSRLWPLGAYRRRANAKSKLRPTCTRRRRWCCRVGAWDGCVTALRTTPA